MDNRDKKSGRFNKKYENILTKDNLTEAYEKQKNIKNTAAYFNVSSGCIIKYMKYYDLPYTKRIKYFCDDGFFSRDNEESFYWAGFMAADGNVSKQNDIFLGLKVSDAGHLEKFKLSTKMTARVDIYDVKIHEIIIDNKKHIIQPSQQCRIRMRSQQMAKDLERFNVIPNKTKVYDFPEWLINHKLFNHFLRGYFDGDGWFSETSTGGKNRICLGFCGNLSVMKKIINVLKYKCKIDKPPYLCKRKNIYKINYASAHTVTKIVNYLYSNSSIFLDRKHEISQKTFLIDENTIILNIDKDKLLECCNRLKSVSLIAKEMNCCENSIRNYIKKYNIPNIIKYRN